MSKPNRSKINYSKKLDELVSECGESKPALRYQAWVDDISYLPGIAGSYNYEGNRGIVDIDNAFEMAMSCPPDKMVWAGYCKPDELIWFIYAADEQDALDIWKRCFDQVIKASKGKRS